MLNDVSHCFSLFLYFCLPVSQCLPILFYHPLFKFTVSKATDVQSQTGAEINTPFICLYYCLIVLFFIFFPYFTRITWVNFAKCPSTLHQLRRNQWKTCFSINATNLARELMMHYSLSVTAWHSVAFLMNSHLMDHDEGCKCWRKSGNSVLESKRIWFYSFLTTRDGERDHHRQVSIIIIIIKQFRSIHLEA